MATTMKALVKSRPEAGLWMEEVPVPEPGINDVLIRILKTGICGTDLHIYNWDAWAQKTIPVPLVVGHEFVGRVEQVGGNVTGFQPGDLVSGEGHLVCGRCRNCMAGRRHLCPHTQGVGVNRPGAFAEYLCIPMTNVWGADPHIPLDVLACFDPLGNAVHTALELRRAGGRRPDHRRGPHRPAWRPPSCATPAPATWSSPTRTPAGWSSPAGWARPGRWIRARARSPRSSSSSA